MRYILAAALLCAALVPQRAAGQAAAPTAPAQTPASAPWQRLDAGLFTAEFPHGWRTYVRLSPDCPTHEAAGPNMSIMFIGCLWNFNPGFYDRNRDYQVRTTTLNGFRVKLATPKPGAKGLNVVTAYVWLDAKAKNPSSVV